jgi:hypothetical protein
LQVLCHFSLPASVGGGQDNFDGGSLMEISGSAISRRETPASANAPIMTQLFLNRRHPKNLFRAIARERGCKEVR